MSARTLVLWDLDLTLLDPAGFGARMFAPALRAVLDREGRVDFRFAGMTDRAIGVRLLEENGVDPVERPELVVELVERFAEACEAAEDEFVTAGGGPLPGAREVLAALAARDDVVQGVATGNSRRTALLKLRACGLDRWLDGSVGGYGDEHLDRRHLVADAIASAGPHLGRDAFVSGAAGIGGAVGTGGSVVVVGDTVHDVRGALSAGATAAGVATGHTDAPTLLSAGATVVLPDLTDTPAVVEALLTAPRLHRTGSRPPSN